MDFQIVGLPKSKYQDYFSFSDSELLARDALRTTVQLPNDAPCRVSLQDAGPGETVVLLNHAHLPNATPYQSSYAIYVRENAQEAKLGVNQIPEYFNLRTLALRGFDDQHLLLKADIAPDNELGQLIQEFFGDGRISYLHIHNAKEGCFHAEVKRVSR